MFAATTAGWSLRAADPLTAGPLRLTRSPRRHEHHRLLSGTVVGTFQALGLLLLAVVPGALLVFSYEHRAGQFSGDANERVLRFVIGTTLVFPYAAALAALTYARVLHVPVNDTPNSYRNRLVEDPTDISLWWTLVPIAYVLVPWAVGLAIGHGHVALRRRKVRNPATSLAPRLTGWDIVFLSPRPKLITVKLRSGLWVAGIFASESYASPRAANERSDRLVNPHGRTPDGRSVLPEEDNDIPGG